MQLDKDEVAALYRSALDPLCGKHYLVQFVSDSMHGLTGRMIEANFVYARFDNVSLIEGDTTAESDATTQIVFRDNIATMAEIDPAPVLVVAE